MGEKYVKNESLANSCWVMFLFNTISLLFIIPYVCIFAVTKIFEHYDITRYDTRPYYNLR